MASEHPGQLRGAAWPEAVCLLGIAVLATAVFASGTVDIAVARLFFARDPLDHWPLARQLPWSLLYRAAPWVTAALVLGGLAALAVGVWRRRPDIRHAAVLVLLGLALGPGLLANVIFKDHWQHPRPRDLLEFGGPLHYVASPLPGSEAGASFPCGHCSVGFMCAAGWWIWRRRRHAWALASLAAGIALGFVLGVGRLAAGGHFLSDVVWSALLAFAVLHLIWYHLLAAPAAEDAPGSGRARGARLAPVAAALAGFGVLLALFAAPHGSVLDERLALRSDSPRALQVIAGTANVDVVVLDAPARDLKITGELHGFGWPGSHLAARLDVVSGQKRALRYRIETRGWLTDLDGMVTLRVPAAAFDAIEVDLGRGNIRVSDLTPSRALATGHIQLDLRTQRGRIERPAPVPTRPGEPEHSGG